MSTLQTVRLVVERWKLLAFIPLLVLGLHFYLFPFLYTSAQQREVPGARELVSAEKVVIGRYQGHEITVSLGDFEDPEYLGQSLNPSAVVIAHYLTLPEAATKAGGAGRSVQLLLAHLSPDEGARFTEFLTDTASGSKGDVKTFSVSSPLGSPLSYVLILMLDINDSAEAHLEVLRASLGEILVVSESLDLDTLFIPTLTVDPRHANAVGKRDFFKALFDAIPIGSYPRQIQLSLYKQWPNTFLSSVLESLNEEWQERIPKDSSWSEQLFRAEFRSLMLFLSLCLLISAYRVPLSLKNTIIISLAYLGAALGGSKTITFVLIDHNPALILFATLIFQFLLAIFLYAFIYWDPKKIFSEAEKK